MRQLIPGVFLAAVTAFVGAAAADDRDAPPSNQKQTRVFEFTYEALIAPPPSGAKRVQVWIPIPQSTPVQRVTNLEVNCEIEHEVVSDSVFGNRFLYWDMDTEKFDAGVPALSVAVTCRIERTGYSGVAAPSLNEHPTAPDRKRYLQPSRLVTLDGPIAAEAVRVAGDAGTPLERSRKLYNHIVDTVVYDKSGDGWGRGDALYACDTRAGNCTDFHSLFIGEARSLGIPARFIIGFPIPEDETSGEIGGYHCWAEFEDPAQGWLPVDASEAFKHPEKRDELFAGLDAHRVQFTVGRDIVAPHMHGEPLNYSVYPYVEVDGEAFEGMTKRFAFRNLE